MRDHIIVGLTGPTGAGKSTVSKMFEEQGFAVINADEIAREVMLPESICLKQISAVFGDDCINDDGSANRAVIARKAFSSKENTKLLNDITHPHIFLRVLKRCREFIGSGQEYILFDAPVLFESNSDIMCDVLVCVCAPKDVRIKRLMARDGKTEKEILRRMAAQHNDEYYTSRCDIVIDGGENFDNVRECAIAAADTIKNIDKIVVEKIEKTKGRRYDGK
ncbi:MAG: dephospho-CoA kinase [Clostridia bacterium]|nr:dephospho-CoA kinase [Clostridia bacterium]